MSVNPVKQTRAQTLAGVAIMLVVVALVFVVVGVSTQTLGAAQFGAGLLGLAVVIGLVGVAMNAFRR